MNDYYSLTVRPEMPDNDALDLLADDLAAIGFESFVTDPDGTFMVAYVPAHLYNEADVRRVADDNIMLGPYSMTAEFIEGRDWNAEWEKNYFQPIVVDGEVAVYSTFHKDVPEAKHSILINPKMAFGTGHHATTVLMMKFLLSAQCAGKDLVDMGTGTGILAILAAKLGARKVLAVEIDSFAVVNTAENLELNAPADKVVELVHGDASALDNRGACADIFLANINRNIITADIDRYAASLRPGGLLTVSGFYVADRPVVEQAASRHGLKLQSVAELDNWSSMTFVKAD